MSRPPAASLLARADPFDLSPQAAERIDKAGISSIDVVDLVDRGYPLGNEPRENQTRPGPNVGGFDRGSAQRGSPPHQSMVPFGLDVSTEAGQFVNETKSRFKEIFRHQ